MINYGEMLLRQEPFSEIVIGNTAIVRAMIESGVRVVTSYPGSPTPEIAVAIAQMPQEKRPFYFEFSTNEKVATEVAYGASVNGHLSCVFFKSVGLNVAADTFVQLGHMNLTGGMVVVLGDDPGAHSSQNEQDNRHFAKLSYTPVLEPSTPGEVYSYFKMAAKISVEKKMPVILRLTTHTCHQKELVSFSGWEDQVFDKTAKFDRNNGPYIPITKAVYPMKRRAIARAEEVSKGDDVKSLNSLINNGSSKGIITAGTTFLSVLDVLDGVADKPDILKLSLVYPLQKDVVFDFLKSHDEVKILEELDPVIENDVKVLAYEKGIKCKISGKNDPEDMIGEYTPDKVREILSRDWPKMVKSSKAEKNQTDVPLRPPQMCPGCGHRSAYYAIKKALKETDIKVGDIGCHTLGFLPPYNMVELLMSMGASTGIASGLRLFNDSRKVVCFLGDSTFFHAGAPGIVNAVFNKHDITLILMENGTTAMTGHQEHPATGHNFDEITHKIPVRQMIEGMGIEKIFEVDTYNQKKLTEAVIEAVAYEGISVVIAKHPCMLKFMREQKRKGVETRQVHIDQQVCDRTAECIENFACPTFYRNKDGSITINKDLCIGDGSCIATCPVSAIKY